MHLFMPVSLYVCLYAHLHTLCTPPSLSVELGRPVFFVIEIFYNFVAVNLN